MDKHPSWKKEGDINGKDFQQQFGYLIEKVKNSINSLPENIKSKYSELEIMDLIKDIYISNKQDLKIKKGEKMDEAKKEKIELIKTFENVLDLNKKETSGLVISALEYLRQDIDTDQNVKRVRNEYEMSNASKDSKTNKISLDPKYKKDIKDIDKDALHEDRVYSEILIKLAAPDDISKKLKILWDNYLASTNKIDKIQKHKEFIKLYNEYTSALEKVLKVFYEPNPVLSNDLEKKIFSSLQKIVTDKKDFKQLMKEYIKTQPDKFYQEHTQLMSEELENTYILNDIFLKVYKYLEMKNRGRKKLEAKDYQIGDYQFKEVNEETNEEENKEKSSSLVVPNPQTTIVPKPNKTSVVDKIKVKTAFIAYSEELAKIYARDAGDRKMSQSYQESSSPSFWNRIGNGFKRIWTHGMFREYYRQKEITKAQKEILNTKNLFADEDLTNNTQNNLNAALIERLISVDDLNQAIHKGEKVKLLENPEIKGRIINIIRQYTFDNMSDTEFLHYQNQLSNEIKQKNPDIFLATIIDANNLLETAKGLKAAYGHQAGLRNVDIDIDIILGNMKSGVRTEQKLSTVDRLTEKMSKTKLGKFINETTLASALSIFQGLGNTVGTFLLYNKVAQIATFGGTALLSGILASMRNRTYWEQKRSQHFREAASGRIKDINEKDKQRIALERFRYQSISASKKIKELDDVLNFVNDKEKVKKLTSETMSQYISDIARIDACITLSDDKLIDLITYSSPNTIDTERTKLDIQLSKLKVALRKLCETNNWIFGQKNFDEYLKDCNYAHTQTILKDENGVDIHNKQFARFKRNAALTTFACTTVTGLVAGAAIQEIGAFANSRQQGLVESWFGHMDQDPTSKTALKSFADFLHNKYSSHWGFYGGRIESFNLNQKPAKIPLDPGRELRLDKNGNYDLYVKDDLASDNIISFEGRKLINNSEAWKQHGLLIDSKTINTLSKDSVRTIISDEQFAKHNSDMIDVAGKRNWIRNNTSGVYDLNEKGISYSVDNHGNPIIDISRMTSKGSFDPNKNIDIFDAIKKGDAKILVSLSKETSGKVFEIPLTSDRLVLDANSPVGSLFSVQNGKMIFNGGTVEVAVKEPNVWNILATSEKGANTLKNFLIHSNTPDIVEKMSVATIPEGVTKLPTAFPPFLPITGGKPLSSLPKKETTAMNQIPVNISESSREISSTIETEKESESLNKDNGKKYKIPSIEERKKLSGWSASYILAQIAENEQIDLLTMSREQYANFAKENYLAIDDDQLRMAIWQRNATSVSAVTNLRKRQISKLQGKEVDQKFNKFAYVIQELAEQPETKRFIKNKIEVEPGSKDSNSWLFFKINGGHKTENDVVSKSYLSLKDLTKLTPDRFITFMEYLRDKGFKGSIKIFQDLCDQGLFLNDQIVMHGSDAKLGLQLATEFFKDEILQQSEGYDKKINGKWMSYSQILAKEIKDYIKTH